MALTDLTGTKWRFNSTITATGEYGIFNLEAETSESGSGIWTALYVGYIFDDSDPREQFIPMANHIVWMGAIAPPEGEFTITGGTDVTNANLISWIQANAEQIIDTSVKLLKSGTSVIGKINGHYVSSVNGTNVMSGIVANTPTGYDVTITFQNSYGTSYWVSTTIYDDYTLGSSSAENDVPATAQQIGSISSANGSTTVTTTTGKLAIRCRTANSMMFSNPPVVSGGVRYISGADGLYGSSAVITFDITGDGTITISGTDWDD